GNRIPGTLLSAVLDVSGLLPADGPGPVPRATGGGTMSSIDVGIDQIGVYLPRYVLHLDRLAEARGVPVDKILLGLGPQAMAGALGRRWEDAVAVGANAAARVRRREEAGRAEIGLLVVATETAVADARPASIFLHELLGLPPSCRTFEIKHACYGGTAGVMLA